jgi:pyridoxine 4-dehydrogenase
MQPLTLEELPDPVHPLPSRPSPDPDPPAPTSGVTREHLLHAVGQTDIVCVQNQLNVVDRASMPVLEECYARGIAFVPFFPLGSAFGPSNAVLGSRPVVQTAQRKG